MTPAAYFSVKLKSLSAAIVPMKPPMPAPTCAVPAKLTGAPISAAIDLARSAPSFLYSSTIRFSTSSRCSRVVCDQLLNRSEEHTSELQSLMRISYAVFCLKKKKNQLHNNVQLARHKTICVIL